jgi:hypothetical protein
MDFMNNCKRKMMKTHAERMKDLKLMLVNRAAAFYIMSLQREYHMIYHMINRRKTMNGQR